jgi:uncharacterized protein (DUF4415 family)
VTAKKLATDRTWKSRVARVDLHVIRPEECDEPPELTDGMFARAIFKKGGRPVSPDPRKLITIRLPASVIEKWRATGPGWQTRMADRLSRGPLPGAKRS